MDRKSGDATILDAPLDKPLDNPINTTKRRLQPNGREFERMIESDEFREKFYESLIGAGLTDEFLNMPIRVYLLWAAKNALKKQNITSRLRSMSDEFDEFVSVGPPTKRQRK
jgi:DNA polymerase III alpha subunit